MKGVYIPIVCDSCRGIVPLGDDALALHRLVFHGVLPVPEAYFIWGTRHIMARPGCSGTPDLAEYLPGQPRDPESLAYDRVYEPRMRAAYKQLMDLETIQHLNGERR